ncbi:MAG: tetratricopeptide repeat protein [Chloroflexota bacterium]|nr:tetratricopeptide repeat protein [Chloroflexota bacterium]
MSNIESENSLIQVFMEQGQNLYDAGNYEKALQEFEMALSFDSQYAPAYFGRARCYFQLDEDEKRAADEYSKAIELDPNYIDAYLERSRCYSHLGLLERAIQDTTKVIELNPHCGLAYGLRSSCFIALDRLAEATSDIKLIQKMDPQNVEQYYAQQGWLLFRAKKDFEKAASLNPDFRSVAQQKSKSNFF